MATRKIKIEVFNQLGDTSIIRELTDEQLQFIEEVAHQINVSAFQTRFGPMMNTKEVTDGNS